MAWYEEDTERWRREQALATKVLANPDVEVANGRAQIEGSLELVSEHGHIYDTIRIRIVYPSSFPQRNQPPSVYLVSHRDRWLKGPDGHIEDDWKLCLFVPGESGINFARPDSLNQLLGVIHTFLLKERIYQHRMDQAQSQDQVATWPGPERSHGIEGVREAVRAMGKIGRNAPCPCGSGKKYKHCHLGQL